LICRYIKDVENGIREAGGQMKTQDEHQIFEVKKLGRAVLEMSPEMLLHIQNELSAMLAKLQVNGRLIVDFREVQFFSPTQMDQLVQSFIKDAVKHKRGMFRGHFLIAKDPSPDVLFVIKSILDQIDGSLYVYWNDAEDKRFKHDDVLNVPEYLRETLSKIGKQGPISSAELAEELKLTKDSVREYVRKLYRRGLLKRKAVGTEDGITYFVYEKFTMRR
jgi:predicted transcriptional regulator